MGFKMTYAAMSSMELQKAMNKLENAPVHGFKAYAIRKLSNAMKVGRQQIAQEYKDQIIDKYAKKDADGKYDVNNFVPDEALMEDFQQVQDQFSNREFFIDRHPLNISDIQDIKISASEMEALGAAFDDSDMESKEAKTLLKSI